jgi:cytochrome c
MFSFLKTALALLLCACAGWSWAQSQGRFPGIGRDATPKEVAAWDIDVRPDFKGLPAGSGSVAKGQDIWEAKCASCHGVFGESNEVFSPLVGGTTVADVQSGRVANLSRADYPGRTTLMKVATLSTLWDYINRAMPWNAPKTLSTDEVYAVTAFMLNLGNVVPDNFVLSDQNIAQVQSRMPNRNGMSTQHALWPGKEMGGQVRPDAINTACMSNCATEPKVASFLPDFARNAHGNLAEQNRLVGSQRGADTTRPERQPGTMVATAPAPPPAPAKPVAGDARAVQALLQKHTCTACHGMDKKIVGPGFHEIARKYRDNIEYLRTKIKGGGVGVWGSIAMPPQSLPDADAQTIARWIAQGASK